MKPVVGDMNTLFIKGFPSDTTEDELLEEFKHFGLVKNLSTVPGKGFGFVSFENSSQAEDAIIGMRDRIFKGNFLIIDLYENKNSWAL